MILSRFLPGRQLLWIGAFRGNHSARANVCRPVGLTSGQLSLGKFRIRFRHFAVPHRRFSGLLLNRDHLSQHHVRIVRLVTGRPSLGNQITGSNDHFQIFALLIVRCFAFIECLAESSHRQIGGIQCQRVIFFCRSGNKVCQDCRFVVFFQAQVHVSIQVSSLRQILLVFRSLHQRKRQFKILDGVAVRICKVGV